MINLSHYSQHDLMVLKAIAGLQQTGTYPYRASEVARLSGLTREETHRALARLLDAGYVRAADSTTFDDTFRKVDPIHGLTEKGLRLSGAWPSGDALVDRIIVALEDAAAEASSPEEADRLKRLAQGLARAGRDIAVAAAAAVLAGRIQ